MIYGTCRIFSSTQWYHDHTHLPEVDLGITGQNVYMGLAGFYLLFDQLEQDLIASRVLPSEQYDIPVVLQDRVLAADGSLLYDPDADNFAGMIGDLFVINGKAQPKLDVERRKYRFRILNGSNARLGAQASRLKTEIRSNRKRQLAFGRGGGSCQFRP
jgi:FtsP/CotA-like multicopper oxidase with cupredoxin domain